MKPIVAAVDRALSVLDRIVVLPRTVAALLAGLGLGTLIPFPTPQQRLCAVIVLAVIGVACWLAVVQCRLARRLYAAGEWFARTGERQRRIIGAALMVVAMVFTREVELFPVGAGAKLLLYVIGFLCLGLMLHAANLVAIWYRPGRSLDERRRAKRLLALGVVMEGVAFGFVPAVFAATIVVASVERFILR